MRRASPLVKTTALMASGVVLALAAAGCSAPQQDVAIAELESPSLDSLRQDVVRLIGEPLASSRGQCRLTAFGAKPCGGPRAYVVYSIEATDSTTLAHAVETYTSEDARLNRELARTSDCQLVTPPQITFVAGQCVIAR